MIFPIAFVLSARQSTPTITCNQFIEVEGGHVSDAVPGDAQVRIAVA